MRAQSNSVDKRVVEAFNAIIKSPYFKGMKSAKADFTERISTCIKTSSDFSGVWPRLAIYILDTSKYSIIKSINSTNYPKKRDAITTALRLVKLYKDGGNADEFGKIAEYAHAMERVAAREGTAGTAVISSAMTAMTDMALAIKNAHSSGNAIDAAAITSGIAFEARWAAGHKGGYPTIESAEASGTSRAYYDYAKQFLRLMGEAAGLSRNPKRRKNPIGARLAFVRKQYPNRPEVFEITEGIVARALGVQSHEIDPDAYRKWEPTISWLAKNVNLLLKKRDAGANVDGQLKILSRSFAHIITPITDRPKHKGYRQVELATLSPKQARKFSSRLISEKVERRQEAAAQSGYRIVKNLGDGYIAAVGTPDLNAPPFPRNADIETQKRWVHDYAKFQGWVGAKLNNCLGFFNGYKIEYPIAKFKEQRDGGKLYAIIDRSGNPVSATLVNSENKVIETNGPNNQPPPESAVPYIEKLNKAMGLASKSVAFHPPQNFDIKITKVIEVILDSNRYFRENLRERRYFVRKAQGYSRQAGADFSKVWPKFVIHILATSKYSALVSVKKINYPKKDEIIAVILRVANLYKRGGSWQEFVEAADAAVRLKNVDSADVKTGAQTKVAVRAAMDTAMNAAIATCADGADGTEWPNLAAGHAKEALYSAASAAAEAALATRSDAAWDAAYKDYAGYLLKLLHEAASDAGRNLQAAARRNPRRSKRAKPVDPAISKCRGLWDSYYASPTKRNLAAVLKHLEIMKLSKSKTVLAERARCLRIARKERA